MATKIEVKTDNDVKQFANTNAGKAKAAAEILVKMAAGEAVNVKKVEV
jgi:putative methionine-R-sulfoxide reductase with GAF domain